MLHPVASPDSDTISEAHRDWQSELSAPQSSIKSRWGSWALESCAQGATHNLKPSLRPTVTKSLHLVSHSHPETLSESCHDCKLHPMTFPHLGTLNESCRDYKAVLSHPSTPRNHLWGLQGLGAHAQWLSFLKSLGRPARIGSLCPTAHPYVGTMSET